MTGKYEKIGTEIGKLVEEKQKAYGDAFGRSEKIIKVLYPNGVKPEDYKNLLTITRIIDKLFRIANDKNAFNEDPFRDIAGYGILGTVDVVDEKEKRQEQKLLLSEEASKREED